LLDAHPALIESVGRAIDIMKRAPGVLSSDRFIVHLTLMYICCASRDIARSILLPAFRSVSWQPLNISYSKAVCNADGSIILLADASTQASLSALVEQFENAAAARGFIMQARVTMEAFHTTIGTVNRSYPMQQTLIDINTEIPVWTPHSVQFDRFWLLSRDELQFWPPEEVVATLPLHIYSD
jgi:2'-5' RNA ligase